ncbi:hypothetical protein ACZ90_40315 [Streptomyces albus subsp. albus]|nr:hypothetical protein ACZ90_40315 [Streptomyces albus subsp. albus]
MSRDHPSAQSTSIPDEAHRAADGTSVLPADGAKRYSASAISVSRRTIDVVGDHPATGSQENGPGSVLTVRR